MFMDSTRIEATAHALQRWRERVGKAGDGREEVELAARRACRPEPRHRQALRRIIGPVRFRATQQKGRIWFVNEAARAFFLMASDAPGVFFVLTVVAMDSREWDDLGPYGRKTWERLQAGGTP